MIVRPSQSGQNYRLTRAVLRLGTFTVSELEDLTGAPKNTIYSFLSRLRDLDDQFVTWDELESLRGRPQKRYTLTGHGTNYLTGLNFEQASHFSADQPEKAHAESISLPSDIYEQDRNLVIQVEIPGLTDEDVEVRIEHNVLIVSGERPATLSGHGTRPQRIERLHGHFARSFPLPEEVETKIRNIRVRNGVLEVILEKTGGASRVETEAIREAVHEGMRAYQQMEESSG
jgi:HSP20 family molecular chaperone IbpA